MRSPITWHGGKGKISKWVVSHLPEHTTYVEPFAGGLSVLFAKPRPAHLAPSEYVEVINDTNSDLVAFYRVLRDPVQSVELHRLLELTPYAREEYNEAKGILAGDEGDAVRRAWAFWILCRWSFGGGQSSMATSVPSRHTALSATAAVCRIAECHDRLRSVAIEHDDALAVITRWDRKGALFYCDPPYPGTEQKQYSGWTNDDLAALCDVLEGIKGSFVLSGYPSDVVPGHWPCVKRETFASCNGKGQTDKRRTECLWVVDRN